MSRIMDMSDDELINHYFDMAHLRLTAETKDHDVAFFHAVVLEMAERFARNGQDPDEEAADGNI